MANVDNIITINISIADAAVTQAGFGTPMILTHESPFGPELVRIYSGTAAMVTDGFAADGPTVAAATAIFAQNPKVTQIKVGRRTSAQTAMTRVLTVAQVLDSTLYTVTINGTAFTFTSDATATNLEIAAGLVSAINLGSEPVTATDNVDGTFDLVEDAPLTGLLFGLTHTINLLTQDDTTAEAGIAADYAAVKVEDEDFYGVLMTSSATLEIVALATPVEADRRAFLFNSSDEDILTNTAGNLFETLATSAFNRTMALFSRDNFDYSGPAWMGDRFPSNPGSSTWAFKALAGVATDTLSDTQISNIEANNGNHYTTTSGLNMTLQGTAFSGRFMDITRGVDWLGTRMQERLLTQLANLEKMPYTSEGVALAETQIRAQLQQGITRTVLASDPAFTVQVPDVNDPAQVTSADKANRLLPDLGFSAPLAGAIHKMTVNGTVSV